MNSVNINMYIVIVCFSLTLLNVQALYVYAENNDYPPDREVLDKGSTICWSEGVVCPEEDPLDESTYYGISNISQFCQCSNGKPYLFNCPDGEIFNDPLHVCVDPEINYSLILQGMLKDGYGPDQTTLDEGTQICKDEGVDCPKLDGEYPVYSAVSNCAQFCQCSNGRPYLFNCPPTLIFDQNENVCVHEY